MALHALYTSIKDHETLCYHVDGSGITRLNPVTEALVFSTMAVGLGKIRPTGSMMKAEPVQHCCDREYGCFGGIRACSCGCEPCNAEHEPEPNDWREFFARLRVWEQLHGPYVVGQETGPRFITSAEVKAHIGLHCNVVDELCHDWAARIIRGQLRDVRYANREDLAD